MASPSPLPPSNKPSEPQTVDPVIAPAHTPTLSSQESQAPAVSVISDDPTFPAEPPVASGGGEAKAEKDGAEGPAEEEEEKMECGFCLFMKGGGCKDAFVAWEKCVEDAERSGKDVADKCLEVTSTLRKCMEAHADYYQAILRAEQAMADAITASASEDDGPGSEEEVKDS